MSNLVELEMRGNNYSNLSIDRFDESITILLKLELPLPAVFGYVVSSHEITRLNSRQGFFYFEDNLMKVCFKCELKQPLDNFYKHPQMADGRVNKCKECNKKDVRDNYGNRRSQYAEYERKRFQTPERKASILIHQRTRRSKFPETTKARNAVSNAVRDGRLLKLPCEVCGDLRSQGHHESYSQENWLNVRWLCFKHHREAHGQTVLMS